MAHKIDLIDKIAADNGMTKVQAGKALSAVVGAISKTLADGERVTLTGFGTFSVRSTAARKGRNPATGKPMNIKAGKRIGFSAGSKLSASVKGKK
jgi:DNA-binding protein HU-beta